MRRWTTPSGVNFQWIHWTDDPEKVADPNWEKNARKAFTAEEWSVEMDGDETIRFGDPVYVAYDDALHNPAMYRDKPFPWMAGSYWICGWDAGQTRQPAIVVQQVVPSTGQVLGMSELFKDGFSAEEFAPFVEAHLRQHYPRVMPEEWFHVGDPTITTQAGSDSSTAQRVLAAHGFRVKPVSNVLQVRLSNVSRLLSDRLSEEERPHPTIAGQVVYKVVPRYMVNGKMCPMLIEGFRGSYKYPALAKGVAPESSNAVYRPTPVKNRWSHPHDANQYASQMAWKLLESAGGVRVRSYVHEDG